MKGFEKMRDLINKNDLLEELSKIPGVGSNNIVLDTIRRFKPAEMAERSSMVIKGWANLKAGEHQQEWTEDDELLYRTMFNESLMVLPDEKEHPED